MKRTYWIGANIVTNELAPTATRGGRRTLSELSSETRYGVRRLRKSFLPLKSYVAAASNFYLCLFFFFYSTMTISSGGDNFFRNILNNSILLYPVNCILILDYSFFNNYKEQRMSLEKRIEEAFVCNAVKKKSRSATPSFQSTSLDALNQGCQSCYV